MYSRISQCYTVVHINQAYNQGMGKGRYEVKKQLEHNLNKEYVKGKTDGYGEGYQHGFTLAKEKTAELDEKESKRIYSDGYTAGHDGGRRGAITAYGFNEQGKEGIPELYVGELRKQFNKGFQKGSDYFREHGKQEKLLQSNQEEEIQGLAFNNGYRVGKKEGYEDGFKEGEASAIAAMNELSAQQAEDFNNDCPVPNKETQEAMQEVLDKFDYKGVWVSKDNNPDWKIEYHSDCGTHIRAKVLSKPEMAVGFFVGDLFNISKSSLRSQYVRNISETGDEQLVKELNLVKKYPHYYKDIRHLNILDIYRFFDLFEVTDPCLQHSIKKQSVGGKRGSKDYKKDIKEAIDTLNRWSYMQEENGRAQND